MKAPRITEHRAHHPIRAATRSAEAVTRSTEGRATPPQAATESRVHGARRIAQTPVDAARKDFEIDRMTAAETRTRSPRPPARRPAARRSPWEPWMEAILADWRERWPAAFTERVPLAVGISGHIKAALRAEGKAIDRKSMGVILYLWTMHGTYLRAVVRGEMRRNLDGSEAGVPDEAARQQAQQVLDDRAARYAESVRQKQEQDGGAPPGQEPPAPVDSRTPPAQAG
jgi:ProQ/FINO family